MMNVLALGLVFSSLAAAGVWSPPSTPHAPATHEPHLVKEGHRVIMVEYERLVPESATDRVAPPTSSILEDAKEKLKEAAAALPNVGQGVSSPEEDALSGSTGAGAPAAHHAREKICDAYGVCKEKISGLFGKAKEKASDVEDAAKDAAAGVKERAMDFAAGVKERSMDAASDAAHLASDAKEKVADAVDAAKGNASEIVEQGVSRARNATAEAKKNLADILQQVRHAAAGALANAAAPAAAAAELLAFATAYGTCVWVTFVSSHVLAGSVPRQQFGVVQSRLYPVYFRVMTYAVGAAFLSHFFGLGGRDGPAPERAQGYNLLAVLGLLLGNMLLLEPKATKVMFERMKMEKEEGRGRDIADVVAEGTSPSATTFRAGGERSAADQEAAKLRMAKLNRKLKNLNSYSSFLNVMTLMGLTWHLVHLSRRIQGAC